jgi:hypothetical protein
LVQAGCTEPFVGKKGMISLSFAWRDRNADIMGPEPGAANQAHRYRWQALAGAFRLSSDYQVA